MRVDRVHVEVLQWNDEAQPEPALRRRLEDVGHVWVLDSPGTNVPLPPETRAVLTEEGFQLAVEHLAEGAVLERWTWRPGPVH